MISRSTVDIACAKTAVAKREAALIAAVDAHYVSVKAAMTARAAALALAWGETDAKTREAAIKKAHENFRVSVKAARKTLRSSQKAAWQTFKADAKACKVAVPKAESSGESADSDI